MAATRTPATILLLPFDETADGIQPSDAAGHLGPLRAELGGTTPAVVDAFTGRGRLFQTDTLIQGEDLTSGATLLTRDATVQVLTTIDEQPGAWPRTIYARGYPGDQISLGLRVRKLASPSSPLHLELQLFWEDGGGAEPVTFVGGTFVAPAAGEFVLLTATRRWVSTDQVVCTYYVNDQQIAEVTLTGGAGAIGGQTSNPTTVGGIEDGAGGFAEIWEGVVDALKVTNYEMPAEEVRATWLRLTRYQPEGVEQLAALAPPGSGWGRDLSTRIGKLVKIAGQGLGFARARLEELRDTWLPARSYLEQIARWEWIYREAPKPLDSLAARRARVAAAAARVNGYARPQVQAILAAPLDLAADDVEILSFSNTITDGFSSLDANRWDTTGPGTWSVVAGELQLALDATDAARWTGNLREPCWCQQSLSSGAGQLVVLGKLTALTSFPSTLTVGIWLWNHRTGGNGLLWGVKNDGGTNKVGYVPIVKGVAGAFVSVLSPAPALPIWLRVYRDQLDEGLVDKYALGYSTTGPETGYTTTQVTGLLTDPEWAGFGATTTAALAGAAQVRFDDSVVITPEGTRPFSWYAYRDPLLAGTPDLIQGNAIVRRLKPAHTHAAAIRSKSLLAGNLVDGLVGRGPLGGI